ncbi:MAG: hypothetical protein A2599_00295 [Candidatus Staskawiczbacteria bacterium RIFOXYD1_FULL_39_28]|uniref:Conjugal transfer protein TrbC n=1 Tax=Candidatus Staskawiczbacteria bacterium RIFOXYC1_FULL_38_18 TaxID=1802229 RepID=A0A1G2JEW9_9BACT|nr:MAG: hypothetical protein A2401_03010 [Candidatus Staskawiczbacteria bacterium RIFOXYC1_FULL_38_18]OGZ90378.1 MAG: hypothetical protein A2599_00295 [Candidatus Staskawiczbacteria bacterium RIFOXYD1_FULL_39_28]
MNKRLIYFIVFVGLLATASSALAASTTITNFGPESWEDLIKSITNVVAGVIGGLATIMIIVAGIFYLTSAGSPQRIEKGKTALFYAIGGIVIALSAEAIVSMILEIVK